MEGDGNTIGGVPKSLPVCWLHYIVVSFGNVAIVADPVEGSNVFVDGTSARKDNDIVEAQKMVA